MGSRRNRAGRDAPQLQRARGTPLRDRLVIAVGLLDGLAEGQTVRGDVDVDVT